MTDIIAYYIVGTFVSFLWSTSHLGRVSDENMDVGATAFAVAYLAVTILWPIILPYFAVRNAALYISRRS